MFLRIVPVGASLSEVLEMVKRELEFYLNIKVRIVGRVGMPKEAFNHWRKQYNAEIVMDELSTFPEAKFIDKNIPTLMITNHDLYYAGLNFVFGLEDPSKSSAIVSIARLRPEFYDEQSNIKLLKERTVKEVIHEMGHYLGLEHCHNPSCVMSFSPSVADIDLKKKMFCDNCRIRLMAKGISVRG
jgi:archaemetzincin